MITTYDFVSKGMTGQQYHAMVARIAAEGKIVQVMTIKKDGRTVRRFLVEKDDAQLVACGRDSNR